MESGFYDALSDRIDAARKALGRPLTYAQKVLYSHVGDGFLRELKGGLDYVELHPDRVAMQDATAQMAILQFMNSGKRTAAVPTSVHCDHLIQAQSGAAEDLKRAREENREVYDFLKSSSRKFGLDFWEPGAGIIHQVFLEEYAFPGGMMIGTDSHSPNAGGLGMIAIGVGGADAVDVMAGMPYEVKWPKLIGVRLTGRLSGWASPKDVILKLAGQLTVKGGTGYIIEYFGEGASTISCTGKATICNMGAEVGATCSIFPYDDKMHDYLLMTGRKDVAGMSRLVADSLRADDEVIKDPGKYFDKLIEIDLGTIEPSLNGPFTPDKVWPVSKLKEAVAEQGYPDKISVTLIGSCTNSSYEDIDRCASIARQAIDKGLKASIPFIVTPGSDRIKATIERDMQLDSLKEFGAQLLANACGPCIGMWKRMDVKTGERNTIVTSYNRNFAKRNDGNPETMAFVASPEIVTALSIAGKLSFNPMTDFLINEKGEKVRLEPPSGQELPRKEFSKGDSGLVRGVPDPASSVKIIPGSERITLLEPFEPWDGKDLKDMPVLLKAKGKCTTDHISPAGQWLKYRGHMDNISKNLLIGAINAFTGDAGLSKDGRSGQYRPVHEVARDLKAQGVGWVVVGEENYGEGSSREHAAMEPRYLGGKAIIAKSFARIHESNLKKQGILALTFADPSDYDRIQEDDRLSIMGLDEFEEGKPFEIRIRHSDGNTESIYVNHTYSGAQFEWFKAGSALNLIAASSARDSGQ